LLPLRAARTALFRGGRIYLANHPAAKKTTIETFLRTVGSGILALKEFNRGF